MRRIDYILLLVFCRIIVSVTFTQEINHNHSVHYAFIENKGQWKNDVLFKHRMDGGNVWVEQNRILFQFLDYSNYMEAHASTKEVNADPFLFHEKTVELKFLGSREVKNIYTQHKTSHYFNFFKGKDKSKWVSGAYGYGAFSLEDIYKGIDLTFMEQEHKIKYEFVIHPRANPENIVMQYKNHQTIKIDKKGNLIISSTLGEITEQKPYAYQVINGKIIEVDCEYQLSRDVIKYKLGDYDKGVKLTIDPTLIFATFNGAVSDNFGMTATYGVEGTAYMAGTVFGNNYPMPDNQVFDPNSNLPETNNGIQTTDIFLTKYSADGSTMLWSTFFGGGDEEDGTEVPHSLISDEEDNIYLFGSTSSTDFPVTENVFQAEHAGGDGFRLIGIGADFNPQGTDIFVAKFSPNGHDLLGSTYVGGSDNDGVNYKSSGLPYAGVNTYDSLVTNYGDQLKGEIMLDSDNNIIVASSSRSTDFPVVNAFQPNNAGKQDGVIFKLKNDFTDLMWSTYFGGNNNDGCYSLKLDTSENVVIAGGTTSNNLNVSVGAYQETYQGGKADGFIIKLSGDGENLLNATYLGTPDYDQAFFVEIGDSNSIYVFGQSRGGNFPVVGDVYSNPNSSQFIAQFNTDLTEIIRSTVIGSGNPQLDIAPSAFLVDVCGNVYISGWGKHIQGNATLSNMPVSPNAFLSEPQSGHDFYLMVLQREIKSLLYGSYLGGPISDEHNDGGTSRFNKKGVVYQSVCGGCGGNSDFPTTDGAWSNTNNSSNCNGLLFKFEFNILLNASITVENDTFCISDPVQFINSSSNYDSFVWHIGDSILTDNVLHPSINFQEPGTYDILLIVTDSICLKTDTAEVTIEIMPDDIILEDLEDIYECNPLFLEFKANSFGTANTFIWSSNSNFTDTLNESASDSTLEIFANEVGYLYVKATDGYCEVIDSVYIFITTAALDIEGEDNLCLEDTTSFRATSLNDTISFSNYNWQPDDLLLSGQGTNEVTVFTLESQYLNLTADASDGCVIMDSVFIQVSNFNETTISAEASSNQVPAGGTVTLTALPSGFEYAWTPEEVVFEPSHQITDALIYETTLFTVFITDSICTASAKIGVETYDFVCDEPFIFVPNAFTPNGDGENDVLFARSTVVDDTKEFIFRIFNRWGEKVFETNDISVGWDGTFKGKRLAPDVYDYYLEGFCIDNQSFLIQGNITLVR